MNEYLKKIITVMLSIVIFSTYFLNDIYSYDSKSYTKGHYLIINSKYNKMGYYKDGELVKEFKVATGKLSTPTPQGKFKIVNKIKNRPYYSGGIPGGDPRNPLGDRWLGLHVGFTYGTTYAIHGNNNPSSIGKNISAGCIRMYNSDIRWLFDKIPVYSYAIVSYTDKSYKDIAAKYGIKLSESLTNQQKIVEKEFEDFYIYGPKSNPTIDLSNKNEPIKTIGQANGILRTTSNGKIYDRQYFINAWNKLSSKEKSHDRMKEIYDEYKKIVSISEAAKYVYEFYDNVYDNDYKLIDDASYATKLNSKSNTQSGARGKAYTEYMQATKYKENSKNSARMKYINDKYLDAVYFLNVSKYLDDENTSTAMSYVNKIKNSKLKEITLEKTKNIIEYKEKKAKVEKEYKDFYIYGPKVNPTIDLSNKNELIKTIGQANGILKTKSDGKIYDRQYFLNAWNSLTNEEKSYDEMKKIDYGYNKIIAITEAAKYSFEFFENIKENANTIIDDYELAAKLNSKENLEDGSRGKAYKEYIEATKYKENSKTSARMKYINDKYLDGVYFLNSVSYIEKMDYKNIEKYLNLIKDDYLKEIVQNKINIQEEENQ